MMKRMLTMLLLVAIFAAGLVVWTLNNIRKGKAMGAKFAPPPAAVTTVVAKAQTWQPVLSAVGSLKAVNGVLLSTDLAGIVAEIALRTPTMASTDASHQLTICGRRRFRRSAISFALLVRSTSLGERTIGVGATSTITIPPGN